MITQLTYEEIKDMFSPAVYRRGLGYYREGRVGELEHDPITNNWTAKVKGSKLYQVTIESDNFDISSACTCPAYDQYFEPCKHIAAVMLDIFHSRHGQRDLFQSTPKISSAEERMATYTKHLTNQFIQTFSNLALEEQEQQAVDINKAALQVDWIMKVNRPVYTSNPFLALEMKVGLQRTYVVKNMKEFLQTINKQVQYQFTKHFTYDPTEQEFTEADQGIIQLLLEAINYEEIYQEFQATNYRSFQADDERMVYLPPMLIGDLLSRLEQASISFEHEGRVYAGIHTHQTEFPVALQLVQGKAAEFQLDLTALQLFNYLDVYGYIFIDNHFYKLSSEQQLLIKELNKLIHLSKSALLPIAVDQIEPFISQVVPRIEKIGTLEIAEDISNKIVKYPLEVKLFADRVDDVLQVRLEFHYGDYKLNPFEQKVQDQHGPILMRDVERERAIMNVLESSSLKFNGKHLYVEGEEGIFECLYELLPRLEDQADIFMTNNVRSLVLPDRQAPVTSIDIDASGNWLEVSFDMEDVEQEEISNILQSVVEKKKYYRLPNGAFVPLDSAEFQAIQNIMEELNLTPAKWQGESIQLPLFRSMQIDGLVDKERTRYGKQFRRLLSRLNNPEELEFALPDGLQAELRDYQHFGFHWLKTLRYYRLGGILADDMGLGKTLQSIAFILSESQKNQEAGPALVVAPASLVYNWKNEFHKFAPSLAVNVVLGSPQERMELLQSDQLPDVFITSYPTLRQDIDTYAGLTFSTLILDEAQTIKNHATKTAQAVRDIQAQTRFALSGTPIENSIDELWSIFQTIMPHFFPNQKGFRQLDPAKVAKMIRPFLLRRVKQDVLKELPDKIETVQYAELTKEQKELYLAYLEKIKQETESSLQGEGFQKSRMKILAGLTRLRQLCCHPALFLENYSGDSGKLEQLLEFVNTALENKRRMLIFSQFTSMLAIIREQLTEAGFNYFYLDGQTVPKERVNMVERFNQGEADIFLISLKAGNTGLNLTGADMVILYDLWWNPAVEEQAAGRAHRIGQKNVVQVIRFITQGTIEEKIFELQQTKKELIETVLEPGGQNITSITEQDIRDILNI